ncbi:hypothetical protein [uncultured Sphingomonas sp.]|uniref:hypothetical protein n=1 Tax=uncultured Sphingomonas sp. TaxID=158754 RepID=UPI0025FE904F|nr:hypothetical protein [uncultured Sphingomonas sp.]
MGAYRIDKDLTITRVEGAPSEIIGDYQTWDCVSYDADNDIWCNDRGLFEDDLVVAWVGEAGRVPLPAFILGRYDGAYGDPHLALEDVRFGAVNNPYGYLSFR